MRQLTRFGWAMLLLGVIMRVVHFLDRPSFWGDEASLVLNIAGRSWSGLLAPLDYAQIAPIPILWVEHALWLVGGPDERVLRILPLLSGLALLFVTAKVALKLVPVEEAAVAVGFVATSSFLIRYSIELKPYMVDALVAAVLLGLGLDMLDRVRSWRDWVQLALAGTVASLVSAPGTIVGLGVVGALGVQAVRERRGRTVLVATLCGAGWLVQSSTAYRAWYHTVAESAYMRRFWEAAYPRPGQSDFLSRLWGGVEVTLQGLIDWVVLLRWTPLLVIVLALGVWSIASRRGWGAAVMIIVPTLGAFLASAMGRYPLSTRTMLFTLPSLALLTAAGLGAVGRGLARRLPRLRPEVFVSAFLIPSTMVAVGGAILRPKDEELRPLVANVRSHWRGADAVYVQARLLPAWTYYSTDWNRPDSLRLTWMARIGTPDGPASGNSPSRGPIALGQGADLSRPWQGGMELMGNRSGIEVHQLVGPTAQEPDQGWAANEADRIRQAARPRVWLLTADSQWNPEEPRLIDAVRRAGGRVAEVQRVGNSRAHLVAFDTR